MLRISFLAPVILVALCIKAAAQLPATDEQIQHVIDYALTYRQNVPSLECDESMLAQRVQHGKVNWEVKIKATLRELRDAHEPGGFRDEYTFKSVNGKKARPHFRSPYFVYNVFANSLGIGDKPLPACLTYRTTTLDSGQTLQLNIDSKPDARDPSCSKIPDEYHKLLLIDVPSGAVRKVERSISPAYAERNLEIPYVAIDFAPQKLEDQTFWLPVRFEADDLQLEGRMIATYSNFHRYIGETKILPQ
jgi:hypothetical protein